MAITKRFTEQIVVMTTLEQAAAIKAVSDEYGVSVAQVARDAAALGLPALAARYEELGITKPASPAALARRAGRERAGTKRIPIRKGSKLEVPKAVFSAPEPSH